MQYTIECIWNNLAKNTKVPLWKQEHLSIPRRLSYPALWPPLRVVRSFVRSFVRCWHCQQSYTFLISVSDTPHRAVSCVRGTRVGCNEDVMWAKRFHDQNRIEDDDDDWTIFSPWCTRKEWNGMLWYGTSHPAWSLNENDIRK